MNGEIIYDKSFDSVDRFGSVFEIFPKLYGDDRGFFTEVFNENNVQGIIPPILCGGINWIRQMNRSASAPCVVRGMHAQVGKSCQAKLVEAINMPIYDIIIDARPNSKTFQGSKIYKLDPKRQNKLFVPHGFLHGFIVPDGNENDRAYFNYYCDRCYDKANEICIAPTSFLPQSAGGMIEKYSSNPEFSSLCDILSNVDKMIFSEKDKSGFGYPSFMTAISELYAKHGLLWYEPPMTADVFVVEDKNDKNGKE